MRISNPKLLDWSAVLYHWAMPSGQPPASPSQSSKCTAQVVLNAFLTVTYSVFSMCHLNLVRGWPENSLHQERSHAEWVVGAGCSKHKVTLLLHTLHGNTRVLGAEKKLRHSLPLQLHFNYILVATCTYKLPIATGIIMELLTVSPVRLETVLWLKPCSLHSDFIRLTFVLQQFRTTHQY